MSTYTPRPGSFPARLIEHLTAVGGTMTKSEMAQGFGEPRKNIDGLTTAVIKNGLIVDCGARDDGKRAYGLPGADPLQVAPAPAAGLTLGSSSSGATLQIEKAKKTRRVAEKKAPEPAPVDMPAPTAPPPIAALWEDGDICLYGLQINADESATIGEAHARRLHKFLERVFGPNE
jgi:hypothetical protein